MRVRHPLFIILILILLTINTANALSLEPETWISFKDVQSIDYTPPQGKIIVSIEHYLSSGDDLQGIIYYGARSLNYRINYTHSFLTSTIYLQLGNKNLTITDYDAFGFDKKIVLTYSYNSSSNKCGISLIYDDGSIFKKGIGVEDDSLLQAAIYKVVAASNQPVTVKIGILSYSGYQEGWETTTGNEGNSSIFNIQNLLSFAEGAYNVISGLIYYFNLIFIDNGILTFALFESLVLAWSVLTSRNIFAFYRKYINAHKALFEFLIYVISKIVQIFTSIINALKPL